MPVNLPLDHPTLVLRNKIQELSQNFLTTFGFNYFQYLRCYADGSAGLLTNNTGLMEYFQHVDNSPVIFSSFSEDHKNLASYWFLWDEELPSGPVQLAREKFQVCNGLTLVRRSKTYYDMIAVALPKDPINAGSFYLNKLKAIEQFISQFDKDNKDLIAVMDKNPLALPPAYRDLNYEKICLSNGRIEVQGKKEKTYITAQELACLRWLIQGASYKEIAYLLELSPRTVETYLDRVKLRTGHRSRFALEHMLSLCP
jgi:DNA-binding CsgD family transcriptional regulator